MIQKSMLAGLGVLAVVLSGCGGSASASKPAQSGAATAQKSATAQRATSTPEPSGQLMQIGQVSYSNWGERDARKETTRGLDAGDFYFKGTFIQGEPGQKLTLQIRNVADQVHNFSIPSQSIDQDIQPKSDRVNVEVTFPQSGTVQFLCKLHTAQGMNGLLTVGGGMPQSAASPQPSPSPQPRS
jgi:plastocyanin